MEIDIFNKAVELQEYEKKWHEEQVEYEKLFNILFERTDQLTPSSHMNIVGTTYVGSGELYITKADLQNLYVTKIEAAKRRQKELAEKFKAL